MTINKNDEQVIYDCYFMSKSEFVLVYSQLYPNLNKIFIGNVWHDVRRSSPKYNPDLRITKITPEKVEAAQKAAEEDPDRFIPKEESSANSDSPGQKGIQLSKEEFNEKVSEMYHAGVPVKEIAAAIGADYRKVYNKVKRIKKA